jgi:hypothetical protein
VLKFCSGFGRFSGIEGIPADRGLPAGPCPSETPAVGVPSVVVARALEPGVHAAVIRSFERAQQRIDPGAPHEGLKLVASLRNGATGQSMGRNGTKQGWRAFTGPLQVEPTRIGTTPSRRRAVPAREALSIESALRIEELSLSHPRIAAAEAPFSQTRGRAAPTLRRWVTTTGEAQ